MGKSHLFDELITQFFVSPYFLLLARLCGFFSLSPLFSKKGLPQSVRIGGAIACSLLLAPLLLKKTHLRADFGLFWIDLIIELLIGYLVGFLFSLILEAAAFAGQVVGTLIGLSATELLDPIASPSHPLLARFFSLFVLTFFFALDLHHPLLKLLFESFEIVPLNHSILSQNNLWALIETAPSLFQIAIEFALFPLLILLSLIAAFGLLSRFFPIFWIGFPLQLLVGFIAIGASVGWIAPIVERSFFHFLDIVKIFIVNY